MRLVISEACISCGLCTRLCPEIFYMDEERKIRASGHELPEPLLEATEEALDSCPVQAIKEETE